MISRAPLAAGAAALAVAALSLLLPSTPAYDPWAWLVWGREVASLELDTTSGPAWKPLPVLVTALLAPLGDAAPWIWLALARAAGLLAVVLAFAVAARLARTWVAGAAAAAALVVTVGFARGVALGTSEGLLAALVLLGVQRHLAGRRGQAFAAGAAAALLRPEIWPFLAAYGAWLWAREPRRRPALAAAAVAVPALWFLPDLWGSGELLRSTGRARVVEPGHPALTARPALATLEGLVTMLPPVALVAVAALARRRDAAAALAAGALAWAALVAAMSELGFSGEQRYLLGAAALLAVAGGVVVARVAAAGRLGAAAAALLVAAPLPFVAPAARDLARELEYAAALRSDLDRAVTAAGGAAALRACGDPAAGRYRFPLVAWHLGTPISALALDARGREVILRSRLEPGAAAEPPAPAAHRRVSAAGAWEVLARCS